MPISLKGLALPGPHLPIGKMGEVYLNHQITKIADYLGVSLSYLMTGIEETLPENPKLNERDNVTLQKTWIV